jgi:hypothetical protein
MRTTLSSRGAQARKASFSNIMIVPPNSLLPVLPQMRGRPPLLCRLTAHWAALQAWCSVKAHSHR